MEDARLPTEQEKVAFFDLLGIDRRRLPRRLYHGANGNQTRYFALKLPIAADTPKPPPSPTSIRADIPTPNCVPGARRISGFGGLCGCTASRSSAVAIGADYTATIRAEAALKTWSSRAGEQSSQREYGPSRNDPDVQEEIKYIENAVLTVDMEVLAKYGGVSGIAKRMRYLKDLPKSSGPGATIDGFETWVSDRLRAQETV